MTKSPQSALADIIIRWLQERNGGELGPAFDNMRVADFRNLRGELEMILEHGGRPPNWAPRTAPDATADTMPPPRTRSARERIPKLNMLWTCAKCGCNQDAGRGCLVYPQPGDALDVVVCDFCNAEPLALLSHLAGLVEGGTLSASLCSSRLEAFRDLVKWNMATQVGEPVDGVTFFTATDLGRKVIGR